MHDLYRVTLNGSPIAGLPAVPLQAAAYAAAVMAHAHRDAGPGVPAREYGVEYSMTVPDLNIRQWRARNAAWDISWDETTLYEGEPNPIGMLCDAQDVMESGALPRPADVPLTWAAVS